MKKTLLFSLFLFLILIPLHTAEAAKALHQFKVNDQARFNCARTIAIKLFPVDGEFKGAKELKFYQERFANKLAPGLKKIPGIEAVDIVDAETATSADLVLDGYFVDLTTGNRAVRLLANFGAGSSICRVDMTGFDGATGAEIFQLDHYRRSVTNIVRDDDLIDNIDEVVDDVVAGLKSARQACASRATK